MGIYLLILFLLFVLGYWQTSGKLSKKTSSQAFTFILFFFWILSFIRWKTGTDWDSYYDCFAINVELWEFQERGFELFYTYLNWGVKQLTSSYWILLAIIGSIIYPLTGSTIKKFSPLPFVSLLVYLLLRRADIFFVRESIALAFCFYSFKYIYNKKSVEYLLCVLVATQFHNAAFAFFPAYFIFHLKIDIKKTIYLLIFVICVFIILQEYITGLLGPMASIFGESFLDKTGKYLERGFDSGGATSVASAMIRGSLNRFILLLFFLYGYFKQLQCTKGNLISPLNVEYFNKNEKLEKQIACRDIQLFRGLLNLYMFSIFLFAVLAPLSLTLNRLADTYEMAAILLAGFAMNSYSKKIKLSIYILFYIYIAIRFFVGTLFGVYGEEFVPYKTIF